MPPLLSAAMPHSIPRARPPMLGPPGTFECVSRPAPPNVKLEQKFAICVLLCAQIADFGGEHWWHPTPVPVMSGLAHAFIVWADSCGSRQWLGRGAAQPSPWRAQRYLNPSGPHTFEPRVEVLRIPTSEALTALLLAASYQRPPDPERLVSLRALLERRRLSERRRRRARTARP
jgi:hypothetical protein